MLMHQTMRWFGPGDPVSLSDIRKAGCERLVTTLHHIPAGDVWPVAEINQRKAMILDAGMSWEVIENPVHEDLKKQTGLFNNYIEIINNQLLDDQKKKTYPGYFAIGRLKGLAGIKGFGIWHQ